MPQRNRPFLKQEFQDGERPSGQDFADLIDSFLNLEGEDGLNRDENGNLIWSGFTLGPSSLEIPGTLRFQDNQITYFIEGSWEPLVSSGGGDGGAFQIVNDAAVYAPGNVGIGNRFADGDELPNADYLLEVANRANFGESARVRFGSLVCGNGPTFSGRNDAFWAHQDHFNGTNYAFYQDTDGNVRINTPTGGNVSVFQNSEVELFSLNDGEGSINGNFEINGDLEVNGNLEITGIAIKPDGGTWQASDSRVKADIRDFEAGLEQLLQINPVRFRFNGKAGTPKDEEGISVIAQDIEPIFPEMVRHIAKAGEFDADAPLKLYNDSALTYVLVNAVKELTARVQQLEADLAAERQGRLTS
ncbi:MAG: tail fiber domain-containing protein [Leptolyngbya sp. SIOISBB]|nr:tail fiber domain-containing protein [Leptolyngbya sp. SIOISBB]